MLFIYGGSIRLKTLLNLIKSPNQASAHKTVKEVIDKIETILAHESPNFITYMNNEAKLNPTLIIWVQFLLRDRFAYCSEATCW